MTEETSNVVHGDFTKPRDTRMTVRFMRRGPRLGKPGECQHPHTVIDEDEHLLECKDCGKPVDPIKFLARSARHEDELDSRVKLIQDFERKQQEAKESKRRKLMPKTDWKKPSNVIYDEHTRLGCPRLWIRLTKTMMRCYCGHGFGRRAYPELENEVLKAQGKR